MSQSRRHSLHETLVGTFSGLLISMALNAFITPLIVGAPVALMQNIVLTGMFTIASIIRGYFVRRHFNRKIMQAAQQLNARPL